MENQNVAKKAKTALVCSIIALVLSVLSCLVPISAAQSAANQAEDMVESYM